MAINPEELILAARDMLTELPESVIFSRDNLQGLIKPAIAVWQEQTNNDPQKRHDFIVESNDITIILGVADISTEVDATGFRVDFLKEGDIEIAYAKSPNFTVKFVNSLDRLKMKGRQDQFFMKVYLNGMEMRFKEPGLADIDTLNGTFRIRSVVIPSNLADLSRSVMPMIATVVADLAKKQFAEKHRGVELPVK